MAYSDLGRRGSVILKKTNGSGPLALNTNVVIPGVFVQPFNNPNTSYLDAINATDSMALAVAGNKTPQVALRTYWKPSVFTLNFLKSLLWYTDGTTGYTDQFGIQLKTQGTTRVYSRGRCTGMTLTHTKQGAQPGPVVVDLGFAFIYGDNEDVAPPTFSASTIIAGQVTPASQVSFATPATDQIKSWTLQISRVQAYQFSENGTLYADEISTGAPDGGLQIIQAVTATTTPSTTQTISIGTAGAGISITMLIDQFSPFTPLSPDFITSAFGYKMIYLAAGGVPFSFTSF